MVNDQSAKPQPSPLPSGGEDVRVVLKPRGRRFSVEVWVLLITVCLVLAAVLWSQWAPNSAPRSDTSASPSIGVDAPSSAQTLEAASALASEYDRPTVQANGGDPNDLAAYFRPGDPVPTGASVIKALQQSGIRTGLGAFNPPGTSPPLEGLAVPEDFVLPEGYVRHHQVTDEGVTIEPILMFSPDMTLRDAQGRVMAMPANRVVPPELAPPGLPVRWVRPGSP